MNVRLLSFAVVVLLLYAGPLHSETRRLTRDDCVAIALENHPTVMMLTQEQKKAAANYRLSKAPDRIQVNGEFKTAEYLKPESSSIRLQYSRQGYHDRSIRRRLGGVQPDRSERFEETASGETRHRYGKDERNQGALGDRIERQGRLLLLQHGGRERQAEREAQDKYKLKLDTTTILFRNGQRPILDVTKAEVDLASATLEYEKAKNQESLARTELLAALGVMDEKIECGAVRDGRASLPAFRLQ
jgi:outer membrane protein TolC